MAHIGQIEQFNHDTDDWSMYIEKVEYYFEANDIADGRRKAALLSLIGPDTFKLLRSLLVPHTPADYSYDELIQSMSAHFCPKTVFPVCTEARYYYCFLFIRATDFSQGLWFWGLAQQYAAGSLNL